MNDKYTKTRLIAMMCTFIFVFSLAMSGCASVKKIVQKAEENVDDVIHIGSGDGSQDVTSQIVVGEDGKSYLVDSEGNSVVYDATSAYIVSDPNASSIVSSNNKGSTTQIKGSVTRTTGTSVKPSNNNSNNNNNNNNNSNSSTTNKIDTTDEVYNSVAAQRKLGFNKGYDDLSGLANFYLDEIRCYFEYDNRYWLIEFWKGEYAMAAVGCEIGIYIAEKNAINNALYASGGPEALHYPCAEDQDTMYMSMDLYQYKTADATSPVHCFTFGRRKCWWAAQFSTGNLYRHSDRTSLIMIGSVEFTSSTMMNLFLDQLEDKGFKEGSITSYKNNERYAVSGKKVTVCWKNFKEA